MSRVVAGGARTPWCQRPFPSLGGWVRLGRVVERSVVSRSMEEKGPLPLPLRYAIENGWKGRRVEGKETKRWMPSNEEDGGRKMDACAGKGQRTRRRKRCRKRSNLKSMDEQRRKMPPSSVVGTVETNNGAADIEVWFDRRVREQRRPHARAAIADVGVPACNGSGGVHGDRDRPIHARGRAPTSVASYTTHLRQKRTRALREWA